MELGREYAALQRAAPHRQRRIVHVRDPFGDGEAESSTVHLAARRIGAHEAVEDPGQERFGDADAAVSDGEHGAQRSHCQRHFDPASSGRVLDGVVQ